jgi:hypothetical protein
VPARAVAAGRGRPEAGQVGERGAQLAVGAGGEGGLDAILELGRGEAPGGGVLAQRRDEVLALAVAHAEVEVALGAARVEAHVARPVGGRAAMAVVVGGGPAHGD